MVTTGSINTELQTQSKQKRITECSLSLCRSFRVTALLCEISYCAAPSAGADQGEAEDKCADVTSV